MSNFSKSLSNVRTGHLWWKSVDWWTVFSPQIHTSSVFIRACIRTWKSKPIKVKFWSSVRYPENWLDICRFFQVPCSARPKTAMVWWRWRTRWIPQVTGRVNAASERWRARMWTWLWPGWSTIISQFLLLNGECVAVFFGSFFLSHMHVRPEN